MNNRDGKQISAQVSKMGEITINQGENFVLEGHPFQLKNDSESSVTLQVNLYGMEEGTWISTIFYPGWNPEILRAVKADSINTALKWGY